MLRARRRLTAWPRSAGAAGRPPQVTSPFHHRPRAWPVARSYSGVTADAKWVELTREWRRLCAPKESAREVLLTRLCARPLQDAQLPPGNRPYLLDTTGPRLWRLRAATSRAL